MYLGWFVRKSGHLWQRNCWVCWCVFYYFFIFNWWFGYVVKELKREVFVFNNGFSCVNGLLGSFGLQWWMEILDPKNINFKFWGIISNGGILNWNFYSRSITYWIAYLIFFIIFGSRNPYKLRYSDMYRKPVRNSKFGSVVLFGYKSKNYQISVIRTGYESSFGRFWPCSDWSCILREPSISLKCCRKQPVWI
mgnify:CR=1 FL=1